jgi:predicted metal-dependent phosphoesterase TrpH
MELRLADHLSRRGGVGGMRCDLHVHSRYSGPATLPVLRHLCNESYSAPEAVYTEARRRGMELVTLTDHDTIQGALEIAGRPDTFMSEEVTCLLPGDRGERELHIGVYDITEEDHTAISARRRDAEALFAYLAERKLPATLNHPFSALTGRRETADLLRGFRGVRLVETLNGMLPEITNRTAEHVAQARGLGRIGGSDAHTLAFVGCASTSVPGARTKQEYLDGLRCGRTIPVGRSGSYRQLTSDLVRVAAANYRDAALHAADGVRPALRLAALLALAPLSPLLPVVGALVVADEQRFARRHFEAYCQATGLPPIEPTLPPTMNLGAAVPALPRVQ